MKNLIIGFLLGTVLLLVLGAHQPRTEAPFGFAVPANGRIVLQDKQGQIYIVGNKNEAYEVRIPSNQHTFGQDFIAGY